MWIHTEPCNRVYPLNGWARRGATDAFRAPRIRWSSSRVTLGREDSVFVVLLSEAIDLTPRQLIVVHWMPDDRRIQVNVVNDGLTALLSVTAGSSLDSSAIDRILAESNVVAGVDEVAYGALREQLLQNDFSCGEIVIAQGRAPTPSQDASFEPAFQYGIQAGHTRGDGTVDYHDRDLLKAVSLGMIVGVMHPAIQGTPGLRVDGTSEPVAKPKQEVLRLLDGVEKQADGTVRATRDGVILYKPGQSIGVVGQMVHQGPVDLHSGNLNMMGSLVVKGDILRPFSVTATGDLDISGSVQASNVRAGGNLRVHAGIRGGVGCLVCADGDLVAKHAESATLVAGGRVTIQHSVNSQVAARDIHIQGHMRGGAAVAERHISVAEVGSENGVITLLKSAEPLELPAAEAQRLIATAKTQRLSERVRGRSDDRAKGGKIGRAKATAAAQEIQRLAERASHRESLLADARIEVTLAHPGVVIQIGEATATVATATRATRFSFDHETRSLRSERNSQ